MSDQTNQQLPDGWIAANIGDVLNFNYGKGLTAEKRKEGAIPVYGSNGRVGFHDESLISGPALIIGRKGSVGEVHYEAGDCYPIDTTYFINNFHGLNPRFVFHQLHYLNLGKFEKSTAIPGISRSDIYDKELLLCPVSEQERIADTIDELLSDLDVGVAALESVRKKLGHYRAAVLKAAVEGSLTAEWRREHADAEPASQLLTRILAERRQRWESEQLRKFAAAGKEPPKGWKTGYKDPSTPEITKLLELPKNWTWTTVDVICSVIVDCAHSTPTWTDDGYICVRTTNFRRGYLDLSEVRYVSAETYDHRIERLKPEAGDVLYSREGGILGIACCVPSEVELCMGQRMMLMRVNANLPSAFLMHVLNSPRTLELVKSLTAGSASPHLNVGDIKQFAIPLPSLAEQQHIVEELENQISVIDHIEAELESKLKSAQALRQSILRHAFTGQLVAQDAADEPASELLKRIADERKERARQAADAKRSVANPKQTRKRESKLDVAGIDLDVSTEEIVEIVREGRERS